MAELALGLTKTVVEVALSRIQSAIEEEGKLKDGVALDLAFITGEFQMMQSVLKVANKERAKKNEVVRTWVRQLRDLAFNVEDWVELVAHLDRDKPACAFWWRVVPSWAVPRCVAPPQDLDEAAAEMKVLKSRVEDVSLRATRYNLFISNSDSDSSESKTIMPAATEPSSFAFQVLRQLWKDANDKFHDGESLKELINSEEEEEGNGCQVISLWGSGNLEAMSYIINEAYHDPEICQKFRARAWVKMMPPFKLEDFLNTLVAQLVFMGPFQQTTKSLITNDMAELLQQVTTKQRYLVVLEQVSNAAEWEIVRKFLPPNENGSRIIVSTQHLGIALFCMGRQPYIVSELERFSDGRPSICAFHKKQVAAGQSQSDIDKLKLQIQRGGVISVYGDGPTKSRVAKRLFRRLQLNRGESDFDNLRWVPVVGDLFDLVDFSRRLYLCSDYGFYDGSLQESCDTILDSNLQNLLRSTTEYVFDIIRRFLSGNKWLVVIDGLRSTDEWDEIKSNIFSKPNEHLCVVVVTDDYSVARYCVDDDEDRLVHVLPQGDLFTCRRELASAGIRRILGPGLHPSRKVLYEELSEKIRYTMSEGIWHPVVSVWGIAGVGKSALVRLAFTNEMLVDIPTKRYANSDCCIDMSETPVKQYWDQRFRYYWWVDVPHPFSLAELSRRLLLELGLDDPEAMETAMVAIIQGQDPTQECLKWLHQRDKWLLVLDGLQSTDEWDSIKEAFCLSEITRQSSMIFVTTNEESVAMHCVDGNMPDVVSVQGLEADAAVHLFTQKIDYWRRRWVKTEDSLFKSVMAKCGGLPVVITAVGEWYSGLSVGPRMVFSHSILEFINDNFIHRLEALQSLRGLFSWMRSYLETCKDELKPCIFYLPVFPVGYNIRWRRLIQRWIAEGYSRDTFSNTAEGNAKRLMHELEQLSIIQPQQSKGPYRYRANGFFHEYITSRPMEDNLVFALEGNCSLNSQRVGQHLTIRNSWDRNKDVFESIDFSRLRSLTVFGDCKPFMFDPEKIKMRHVRVLDLEDASGVTDEDVKSIMELLPRLKFLSLRGHKDISRLPESLGRLMQLQTLDVRDTSIAVLPQAIIKLPKLQYIRAGTIIHWDEGRSMVICTPAEDATVAAAVPTSPQRDEAPTAEDTPTASTAPSVEDGAMAPSEGTTMVGLVARTPAPEAAPPPPSSGLSNLCCQAPRREDVPTTSTAPAEDVGTIAAAAPRTWRRAHDLLPNWLPEPDTPAGIGNLTALHTFGVVNVGKGSAVVKELKWLTQLRRIGVSGINPDNIHEFFSAISGLSHLQCLLVRIDKNKRGSLASLDSTLSSPPKTLIKLKLHGHLCIRPGSWIKKFAVQVKRLILEVTVQTQQDMQVIIDEFKHDDVRYVVFA
ncbi:unnamed protein product [Urochloa decumbens]|uniref:Uncharacterized protein n=1 Tax=Urochloa decumbens TaxID=240449 RepID=A0ABC9B2L0_9POAL